MKQLTLSTICKSLALVALIHSSGITYGETHAKAPAAKEASGEAVVVPQINCPHNKLLQKYAQNDSTQNDSVRNDSTQSESTQSDPIQDLNDQFRNFYMDAKQKAIKQTDPIIYVNGGVATLIHNGKEDAVVLVPDTFRIVKSIDHTVLAIFTLLEFDTGKTLSTEKVNQLSSYLKDIESAMDYLPHYKLSKSQLERQAKILGKCDLFLKKVIADKTISQEKLDAFCYGLNTQIMQNSDDAAALELGTLHDAVRRWNSSLSEKEWQGLKVLICDAHMARTQDRYLQYFYQVLGEDFEGDKIIFCEDFDKSQAINLLGTHVLDSKIGRAFFKDKMRMHKDLMADSAAKYIKETKPSL